jgi:hypothetical protein
MKTSLLVSLLGLSLLALPACNETETDDLSKAQQCLDQVNESNPTTATDCLQYTAGYTSQQAEILNCSIYMTAGGLVTSRIASAYEASQDSTITNKNASYMAFLALNLPTAAAGYTAAQNAQTYCNASGDAGLIFISNLSVMGSWLNSVYAGANGGSSIDFSNPAAVDTAVTGIIDGCQANPPAASCDSSVIGPAATTAATAYCATASANASVCSQINTAVTTAGGNNDKITQGLMCLLANKTYDPVGGTCI